MAHALRVLHCLFPVALGVAPVIPPQPVALPFGGTGSKGFLANAGTGKTPIASASSSAPLASGLQGQSPMRPPIMPTRTGLDEAKLMDLWAKSQELREASPDGAARSVTGKFGVPELQPVHAATSSVSSWALGAFFLAAASATGGLWWRRRQALKMKDVETEMTASSSVIWPQQPNAVAAFAGESVEIRHKPFDPAGMKTEVQHGRFVMAVAASRVIARERSLASIIRRAEEKPRAAASLWHL